MWKYSEQFQSGLSLSQLGPLRRPDLCSKLDLSQLSPEAIRDLFILAGQPGKSLIGCRPNCKVDVRKSAADQPLSYHRAVDHRIAK